VGSAPYEIRVRGKLGEGVAKSFRGFEAEVEPSETVLRGSISDQAELGALLDQIEAFGLELIEVRRLDPADEPSRRRSA
jgi:hypothetical protein